MSEMHSTPDAPSDLDLPVILLSHRAPVTFGRDESGERTVNRGAGGIVTALTGLTEQFNGTVWVCAADSDEDRAVVAENDGASFDVAGPHGDQQLHLRMVSIDADVQDKFYGVIANPLLWFIQHGLYGLATAPDLTQRDHDAFVTGYLAANELFADAVAGEVEQRGGKAIVMLHDYHFYVVASFVRHRCPDVAMSLFVHIPWPGPDNWTVLPPSMRDPIFAGLLANDVVAFHTDRFARNFLLCVQEHLGLQVDWSDMSVDVGGRRVRARSYPISIDVAALRAVAASPAVQTHVDVLTTHFGLPDRQLILRVDRTDPSKNIVRGFRAYDRMLEIHPELKGRVVFLAMLQPSRQDVSEYADYLQQIGGVVAEVNARHGGDGWQPIDLRLDNDFEFAVAAYRVCDVLLVNALADGMNLVSKEAVVVNERDMVLGLSENTGAFAELGEHAVTLYPFDIEQQAHALAEALAMPLAERRAHLREAAEVVVTNDVQRWLSAQLNDLRALRGHGVPRFTP
jgi:trehalose 6-phosphate synthase